MAQTVVAVAVAVETSVDVLTDAVLALEVVTATALVPELVSV